MASPFPGHLALARVFADTWHSLRAMPRIASTSVSSALLRNGHNGAHASAS
jgi:hypothetical protein